MKKVIFLLICSALLLSACGNNNEGVSEMPKEVSEIVSAVKSVQTTNEMAELLKERMEKLTDSDEYANSDRNKQYRMAEEFVESLKNEGLAEEVRMAVGDDIEFVFGKGGWGGFIFYNTEANLSENQVNASEYIDNVLGDRRALLLYHNYLEGDLSVSLAYLGTGTVGHSVEAAADEKMHETEEKIKEFAGREEYKNAEKAQKVEMALEFMEELQKDGFIQRYDYFENNDMISYTHLNGVLGGISFHDFSAEIDGLAMN